MKPKIKLYTLNSCTRCAKIKELLYFLDISFTEFDCSSPNSKECDNLEDKLNCFKYPIAEVVLQNGTVYHISVCKSSSNKRISADSEESFVNEIKKLYF